MELIGEQFKNRWRARVRSKNFWLFLTALTLITSLVVNVFTLVAIRGLVEPPASGEFSRVLQEVTVDSPTNVTGTLFEETVDELSGGVIPVLLFAPPTYFCGDSREYPLDVGACVDRFDPTYIAVNEQLSLNWSNNRAAAELDGLDEQAELIERWERHMAAHEFAHILQYNYRSVTLPYMDEFEGGFLSRPVEAMAECYAQLLYPMSEHSNASTGDFVQLEFYGFQAPEQFGLCTDAQLDTIRRWLAAIPYPEGTR